MAPGNVARAEEHFRGLGVRVVTGHRYMGGYIGDREAEGSLLDAKIKRVDEVRGYPRRGRPKAPAVCLRRTAEVTQTGVGIRAAVDTGSRQLLWTS